MLNNIKIVTEQLHIKIHVYIKFDIELLIHDMWRVAHFVNVLLRNSQVIKFKYVVGQPLICKLKTMIVNGFIM